MKKNVKHLIIAVSAAAVLAAGLSALLLLPDSKRLSDSDNEAKVLFDKSDCIPEQITVKNSGGEYSLLGFDYSSQVPRSQAEEIVILSGGELGDPGEEEEEEEYYVVYTMQDHDSLELSKTLTDTMCSQLKSMTAIETVDKSGKKFKEYGLDKPEATVSVTFSDDSSYTISLGKESPEGQGVYAKLSDSDNVYLVDKTTVTCFYFEKLQMFDKMLGSDMEEATKLEITGSGYADKISVKKNDTSCYVGLYIMESAGLKTCDDSNTGSLMTSVKNFSATWIAAIEVTDEDIKKYGLDKPFQKTRLEGDDGSAVEIIASAKNSENKFYAMNPGGKIIYEIETEEALWYDVKEEYFYSENIYNPIIEMVNDIEISSDGKTADYDIYRTRKVTEEYYNVNYSYEAKLGEEVVSYSEISTFIDLLRSIDRTEEIPESTEGFTEMLRAKMTYFDNDSAKDELIIYAVNDDKAAVVMNGKPVCWLGMEDARNIKAQISKIK